MPIQDPASHKRLAGYSLPLPESGCRILTNPIKRKSQYTLLS